MREIKFRVWDKNRKRMYFWENIEAIHNNGILVIVADNNDWMLVPPNYELLQYTGLKDEQGKEIYEGDIIRYTYHIGGLEFPNCIETIKWDIEITGFLPLSDYDVTEDDQSECCPIPETIEVIGNIYENPELLEK